MKKWQIENSETSEISEISEILFRVFLFPSFRFCPKAKIENSNLKILEKNIRDFRVFDMPYIHSFYLYVQKNKTKKKQNKTKQNKRREKNAFSITVIPSFCWFIVKYFISNINIQFCYLLYIVFSVFLFFSISVHVNVLKLYKSIEQLYILLLRNSKNRITLSQCLKLLSKSYPTYKAKQTKKQKF